VTTHPALADRPPSPLDPAGELTLAALLELCAVSDAPERLGLRARTARVHGWVLRSSRRAAAWGSVGSGTTGAR
jgi:hypothetical protein